MRRWVSWLSLLGLASRYGVIATKPKRRKRSSKMLSAREIERSLLQRPTKKPPSDSQS